MRPSTLFPLPRTFFGLGLSLGLLANGCAYRGPQVESILPAGQASTLAGTVESPDSAGLQHLVVYGDSLSDPGNLNRNTFGFYLPHKVFYKGRFSNGPVWPDYVEKSLRWSVDNYAVGGALTREGSFPTRLAVTSLPDQIEKSRSRLQELKPAQTLIAIWIGPNNYLIGGRDYEDARGKPQEAALRKGITRNILDIQKSILTLQKIGFRRIAVGTMPQLSGLNHDPRGASKLSDATFLLATRFHNEALHKMISELKSTAKNSKLQLITFHTFEIDDETAKDPKGHGFTRTDAPCYVGSLTGTFYSKEEFCNDPMGYKFWEFIHPNTRMHCYYAAQFLTDISQEGLIKGYQKSEGIARCLAIKNKG